MMKRVLAASVLIVLSCVAANSQATDPQLGRAEALVATEEQLYQRDPANVQQKERLAAAYFQLGNTLTMNAHFVEGLDAQKKALALREELVAKDPRNIRWQMLVVQSLMVLVFDPNEGNEHAKRAVAIMRKLDAAGQLTPGQKELLNMAERMAAQSK
jgi:hypothetical protein